MHVKRLTLPEELAEIRQPWNQLALGVPFRTWEWLDSWWRWFGDNGRNDQCPNQLCALAVNDRHGELIGLAPWYIAQSAAGNRTLKFLGSGEVCSDYLTVLRKRGYEAQVATSLAEWIEQSREWSSLRESEQRPWDRIDLCAINEQDELITLLVERLSRQGLVIHRRPGLSCWRLPLPRQWNDYLATLSKSHRKQLRRCERRFFETGRARLHRVEEQDTVQRGLDILTKLHQRRRETYGQDGAFTSARFTSFHGEVAARLLAAGALGLYWLELDGRPVAAEYQVFSKDVVYAYQSGIEPKALRLEPGRLITLATIRRAIEEGRTAFDFLRGDETYKAHWRARPRPTQDILILPNTPGARLKHNLWTARDQMKSWIKSGLRLSGHGSLRP